MSAAHDVTLRANIIAVTGSSGSGKSSWVKKRLKQSGNPRKLIWDPDGEYADLPGFRKITSARELVDTMRRARSGAFAFVTRDMKQFELWCRCAFAWGNCDAVAEETADVTSPGKAPAGWGELIRRGRKRGCTVYAISQRPTESDKTAIGNATLFHAGMQSRAADRKYIAAELDVELEEFSSLAPLEYFERDNVTRALTRGKVQF